MRRRRSTYRGMAGRWVRRLYGRARHWRAAPQRACSPSCAGPHPRRRRRNRSVFPDDADHHALNEDVPLLEAHGLHRGVGGLEPNPAPGLAVELLDGGLAAVDQRDNHLAVLRTLLAVD